ncbi:CoB--CoM heterodisulfide reductase iron-sulfur subunit A family protein, partial [bacterium]|nr:CoB--CoM heterodisulfide reductase iron-sulfur subunit A family protein [bacterium]
MPQNKKIGAVLVIGGGIGGMQASLDLAKSGFKVYLVENKPAIGGVMLQLDKTFPTNDCAMCTMSPRLVDVASEMNIELLTFSCLKGLTGEPGNFRAAIYREPRYVIEERCTGCGDCIQVCPVKLKNKFNMGLGKQKAIDFYSPQCIPNVVAINRERCLKLTKDKCGLCQKTCKREAIDYNQKEEEIILEVGAVIASPGFELFDPTVQSEYGYGRYPNVVTSLEFERILSPSGPYQGSILRPSDGKAPGSIAWIQCFGSRELKRNYCSSVCCMYATKESIITKDHHPEIDCSIFFIDLRAFGKGFDAYYERAQKIGTKYIRARPSSIKEVPGTKNLKIQYQSGTGEIVNEEFNLIVLSAGVQPSRYTRDLAERLNLKLNAHGFCQTSKFSPLSTNKEGIYAAGPFTEPKDIPETVMQASGAA